MENYYSVARRQRGAAVRKISGPMAAKALLPGVDC
jgi:hypothetical protein